MVSRLQNSTWVEMFFFCRCLWVEVSGGENLGPTVDTKNLHDPKYPIPWELWGYSILRSCRIFSINSRTCLPVGSSVISVSLPIATALINLQGGCQETLKVNLRPLQPKP